MLTFNIDGAIAHVGGMLARMANMQPVMAEIGTDQRIDVQERLLEGKHGPENERWVSWSPFTRAEREKKGNVAQGLLWDTGTLIGSIQAHSTTDGVVIGTDVTYAAELQFGRSDFPSMDARPYLGWNAAGKLRAERMVIQYLEGINRSLEGVNL